MKHVKVDEWMPLDGIILETAAFEAVMADKNILVSAGPGAGKTELLAQKASLLLQTNTCVEPKKILAISFKKDAAANLLDRVSKRCGDEAKDRFVSLTYDAFFKSLLDRFRTALPEEYRPHADYDIQNEQALIAAFEDKLKCQSYLFMNSAQKKRQCEAYLKRIKSLPVDYDLLESWDRLIHGNKGFKASLTFRIINILAEYIIKTNIKIKKALCNTYSHVFLDEFQDTTDLQYQFITSCFKDSKVKITAVGDVKQRIMGWAGAKRDIFEVFIHDFDADYKKLIMNHRSAPRLIELQKQMYQSLQENGTSIQSSEKWKEGEGVVILYDAKDEKKEAELVGKDIIEKIRSGVKCSEICLLSKQKPESYVAEIIKYLNEQGVAARIESEYQDLLKESVVMFILSVIKCSYNRHDADSYETVINELIELNICNENVAEKYFESLESLNKLFDDISGRLYRGISVESLIQIIDQILNFVGIAVIKKYKPEYGQGNYLEEIINKFKTLFCKAVANNRTISEIINNFMGVNCISAMTIHKSKGLEYQAVYFIGLEDAAFWNFKNQPEEDRCAFFVAISRAKQYLAFTFCRERHNMQYPKQDRMIINEFYKLFNESGIVKVYGVQ